LLLSFAHAGTPKAEWLSWVGAPDDVANAVARPASDGASCVTGQMVIADGGSVANPVPVGRRERSVAAANMEVVEA
jgi:NAD(P)-dependent dehydrogenase (short-subunit alcohol dehydrogenase family)